MSDNRAYVRANHRIHFLFTLAYDPDTVFGFVTRNVSAGGLFTIHDRPILIGTPLEVEIDFHDGTPSSIVTATVLRSEEIKLGIHGIAVEFTRISAGTRAQLEAFVARHEHEEALSEIERYLLPSYVEELRLLSDEKLHELLRRSPGM
jgi:hypothetical protein